MELVEPFDFTKNIPVLRIKARDDAKRVPFHDGDGFEDTETRLYDLSTDPKEEHPFRDPVIEARLIAGAVQTMKHHDAPAELFERFEFSVDETTSKIDA